MSPADPDNPDDICQPRGPPENRRIRARVDRTHRGYIIRPKYLEAGAEVELADRACDPQPASRADVTTLVLVQAKTPGDRFKGCHAA
ncbi:unnamed protein product [Lasius platythorax]|uniref:Uncharacterized protein n=1 Tax=Lasius platythorax TaxID=488582 RepID=A0AAV2MXE8_9HYME